MLHDPASPRLKLILQRCNSAISAELPLQVSIVTAEMFRAAISGEPDKVIAQANAMYDSASLRKKPRPTKECKMVVPRDQHTKKPQPTAVEKRVHGTKSSSVQDAEEAKLNSEIDWLLQYLHEDEINGIIDGLSDPTMKDDIKRMLVRHALMEAGKWESLANARKALGRLNDWCITVIGPNHHFTVTPARIAHFLLDTGASAATRKGLVFAQLHYNLKFNVKDCKIKNKRVSVARGPAMSSNVRQLWGFSRVASDPSMSLCTRYIAAVKVVRMLATLRGIDSRRSKLKQIFKNHFVGVAFDKKGPRKSRKPMPWGGPLYSINGRGYADILLQFWDGNDSMCL